MQAFLFTGTLIGVNCAILGINPFKAVKRARSQWDQEFSSLNEMSVTDVNVIPGLPEGTRYSDLPEDLQNLMYEQSMYTVILLDLCKTLGLSEKTILIIEQDLRNQNLAQL